MNIQKILITDDFKDFVPDKLRAAGFEVDYFNDISMQRLLDIVHVSIPLSLCSIVKTNL